MKSHILLLFCLLIALPSVCPTERSHAARKSNILLIVGDDMGYADVGFHGCTDIPTPNLDALARGGVRFTNFTASSTASIPISNRARKPTAL